MDKIAVEGCTLVVDKTKCVVKSKKPGYNKLLLSSTFAVCAIWANAQDSVVKKQAVEMATGMRSNGKIYVVVAVLCMILTGLFIYLINLDKKVSKLEKEMGVNNK